MINSLHIIYVCQKEININICSIRIFSLSCIVTKKSIYILQKYALQMYAFECLREEFLLQNYAPS